LQLWHWQLWRIVVYNPQTVDMLTQTKGLISNRSKWTTRELARDIEGYPISPDLDEAVAWCAEGALCKIAIAGVGNLVVNMQAQKLLYKYARLLGFTSIPNLNDTGGHQTVMRMFDLAIEEARRG
jgi:hypothetical protein